MFEDSFSDQSKSRGKSAAVAKAANISNPPPKVTRISDTHQKISLTENIIKGPSTQEIVGRTKSLDLVARGKYDGRDRKWKIYSINPVTGVETGKPVKFKSPILQNLRKAYPAQHYHIETLGSHTISVYLKR